MAYVVCIGLGVGFAVFVHYELERFKAWGSAELLKLSATLKK
jgi:hypothetical protein